MLLIGLEYALSLTVDMAVYSIIQGWLFLEQVEHIWWFFFKYKFKIKKYCVWDINFLGFKHLVD